jgi:hypothetical protein
MRYRCPFAIVISLCCLMLSLAGAPARAQSSPFCSTTSCQSMANPFGVFLAGCQSCTDGCARPAPVVDGLEDPDRDDFPPVGDLQFGETFAAFTGSTFAVSAPNMIGDNLGGPSVPIYFEIFDSEINGSDVERIDIGSGTGGAVVGRVKLSDNFSPIPRDRVFFDYSYFNNARLIEGGKDVNRFTPGFEKTFLSGMASFEMRFPMLATLDSNITLDDQGRVANAHGHEFGNISMILKGLLWADQRLAIAGGMGVTVPTADDVHVRDSLGNELLTIQNDTVYLTPFLAFLCTPNDTFFYQAFFGVDVATNGNRVSTSIFRDQREEIGRFTDQTMLMFDLSAGAWLYRNPGGRGLTGLATVVEVHYNQLVGSMDVVESDFVTVGPIDGSRNELSFVNMTVGGMALFNDRSMFTVGYGTPVSSDKLFDGELRAFFSRFF